MAKVKLELKDKTDEEIRVLANGHIEAMDGNPNYTTPDPTAAVLDPKVGAYSDKLDAILLAEQALTVLRDEKNALRTEVETLLNDRGTYVQLKSGGDPAKIHSAGFETQSDRTPTTSLPQPQNMVATIGDNAGEIDLQCNAVGKAKSYVWDCQEHPDNAAPTPWQQAKVSTRSTTTVTGLVSGKKYAFRVRALGPNDTESPWSDEAVCMSP